MQFLLHYFLHLIFPAFLAFAFYRDTWLKAYVIPLLTMLVDLDHLLATPVFSPCRCSISFHPLHSYAAIFVYFILIFPAKTRLVATGLLFHMITDAVDCYCSRMNC